MEKLNEAGIKLEQCREMRRAINGHEKADPSIAHSLKDLFHWYFEQENYDEAAKLYKQSLEMYRTVYVQIRFILIKEW